MWANARSRSFVSSNASCHQSLVSTESLKLMFRCPSSLKTLRIAAIAAVLTGSFGQMVHRHQCGCDGTALPALAASDSSETRQSCPFGCGSCHADTETRRTGRSHDEHSRDEHNGGSHDESHCAICSVLAQDSDPPSVLDTACLPTQMVEYLAPVDEVVESERCFAGFSRGPPTHTI